MNAPGPSEETIFDVARQLSDPAEREAYLDRVCAGRESLRAEVEELLAADVCSDEFFAENARHPRFSFTITPDSSSGNEATLAGEGLVGQRIGRYRLLKQIGEGGCGVVFMAEQEEPVRRRVALKIIKLGMDTRAVIARFEAERQALALMDHPNIARVLDAGATQTGRPYFVMEMVNGTKITDFCDQNHFDTRQRLDLFIQICHAIQHAHQKGIIHRDIKPSNILVTLHDGVPVPKVIDFGIAKATESRLTDKTVCTIQGHFIGTPAYVSPEQAEMNGLDVDTRSDIYSLGVLLYELLTGKTPFDQQELLQSGLDEMRRTLREKEPHRPSTRLDTLEGGELTATAEHRRVAPPKLVSLLRGDLDWIVMKALEKDRARRYETANGLAMDIKRHLANEPVLARPPSRLYQFRKLVGRNRVMFAAGTILALALVVGLTAFSWLFVRERSAHWRAVTAEQEQARLLEEAEAKKNIFQAALYVSQGKYEDAAAIMNKLRQIPPSLESAAVFRSLGEWYALQGQWKPAADRFTALLRLNQLDGWDTSTLDYLECGTALVELGDLEGYERFRGETIKRFADTDSPAADRIVKICLLLPADQKTIAALSPLANIAVKSLDSTNRNGDDVFQAAWQSMTLALLEYRRGNDDRAIEWCRRCLAYPEYNAPRAATAKVIMAMACERSGRVNEARAELAQARGLIESKFSTGLIRGTGVQGFWFDWVFARVLANEASRRLDGPVAGDHSPSVSHAP